MRRRWRVVAQLESDALGTPLDPDAPGVSHEMGEFWTRRGARRHAASLTRTESSVRRQMNLSLESRGYAPMRHRFVVERIVP